jgi:hypothetical protein
MFIYSHVTYDNKFHIILITENNNFRCSYTFLISVVNLTAPTKWWCPGQYKFGVYRTNGIIFSKMCMKEYKLSECHIKVIDFYFI